jgi:elongation factor P hydroxylase
VSVPVPSPATAASRAGAPLPALDAPAIAAVFNGLFGARYRVRMIGGAPEPLYLPGEGPHPAELRFREDFAASALHEAAHWCTAGAARRRRVDFGYGYVPAPRDAVAQAAFEAAEAAPQALEAWLARAAGVPFRPSFDDVGRDERDRSAYRIAFRVAAARLEERGAPPRARALARALLARRRATATGAQRRADGRGESRGSAGGAGARCRGAAR